MAEEMEVGCARPTGGPVGESVEEEIKVTLKPGPDLVGKVWEVWKTEMAFD